MTSDEKLRCACKRERIEVGSPDGFRAVTPEIAVPEVVAEDDDDVGGWRVGCAKDERRMKDEERKDAERSEVPPTAGKDEWRGLHSLMIPTGAGKCTQNPT